MRYLLVILAVFLFAPPSAHALWLDSNWDYRVKIEIAPSKVGSGITNFPVYFDLAGMPASFWSIATTGDVRVVESDEVTETAFEIVSFSTSTARGELHFLADSLSTVSSSTFYIYYGNPSASAYAVGATYGRNNVWSNYLGVYHMQDASGNAVNSVGSNNMTVTGSPIYSSASQIYNGIDYSGTGQFHRVTSGGTTDEPLTIQAWFNGDTVTGALSIAAMGTNAGDDQTMLIVNGSLWALSQAGSNVQAQGATSLSTGVWYMGHAVYRTSGTFREIYLNGVSDGTNSTSATVGAGTAMYIADRPRTAGSQIFNGRIDEVRFRASELLPAWITTEYNNQSSTSTFFYVGPQETDALPPEPEATTTPSTILQGGIFSGGAIIR